MFKKVIGYGLVGLVASKFTEPQGFKSQEDFDFPVTKSEEAGGWSLENRCGQEAIPYRFGIDQSRGTWSQRSDSCLQGR